ncbi:MAG: nitroreductase family protein [Eubacteriales bacterium]|nr:nitroreductase family protein [Eubacteriales bacterium]
MDIMELMRTKRTYRRFDNSRKISDELISDIIESARISSSACNLQPLRYIVVKTPELVEKVFADTRWAAALPDGKGTPKPENHPVMFVIVTYAEADKTKWTDTDAGLAMSNMLTVAWANGIGSCMLDNVNRDGIKATLGIPADVAIQTVIGFGYPVHKSELVKLPDDGKVGYWIDDAENWYVPKRSMEDICVIK